MSDLEKVIKGIQECDLNGGLIGNCPYKGILALLKEQDTVRCKDCAYALFKEGVQHGHIVCTKPFTEHWQKVKPNNWFCADGERKNI